MPSSCNKQQTVKDTCNSIDGTTGWEGKYQGSLTQLQKSTCDGYKTVKIRQTIVVRKADAPGFYIVESTNTSGPKAGSTETELGVATVNSSGCAVLQSADLSGGETQTYTAVRENGSGCVEKLLKVGLQAGAGGNAQAGTFRRVQCDK